jgi:hypothetical protein
MAVSGSLLEMIVGQFRALISYLEIKYHGFPHYSDLSMLTFCLVIEPQGDG